MNFITNLINEAHNYAKREVRVYDILGIFNNYPSSLRNILDALKILLPQLISQVLSNACIQIIL